MSGASRPSPATAALTSGLVADDGCAGVAGHHQLGPRCEQEVHQAAQPGSEEVEVPAGQAVGHHRCVETGHGSDDPGAGGPDRGVVDGVASWLGHQVTIPGPGLAQRQGDQRFAAGRATQGHVGRELLDLVGRDLVGVRHRFLEPGHHLHRGMDRESSAHTSDDTRALEQRRGLHRPGAHDDAVGGAPSHRSHTRHPARRPRRCPADVLGPAVGCRTPRSTHRRGRCAASCSGSVGRSRRCLPIEARRGPPSRAARRRAAAPPTPPTTAVARAPRAAAPPRPRARGRGPPGTTPRCRNVPSTRPVPRGPAGGTGPH